MFDPIPPTPLIANAQVSMFCQNLPRDSLNIYFNLGLPDAFGSMEATRPGGYVPSQWYHVEQRWCQGRVVVRRWRALLGMCSVAGAIIDAEVAQLVTCSCFACDLGWGWKHQDSMPGSLIFTCRSSRFGASSKKCVVHTNSKSLVLTCCSLHASHCVTGREHHLSSSANRAPPQS